MGRVGNHQDLWLQRLNRRLRDLSRRSVTGVLVLLVLLSCGPLPDGNNNAESETSRDEYPTCCYGKAPGATLENLEFLDSTGKPLTMNDLYSDPSNKLLLLSTSANWCVACIEEQPVLQALYETYSSQGLVVMVSLFEDAQFNPATVELAAEWKERFNLTFLVVADPEFVFETYYDASLTPMTMLVDLSTMEILEIDTGFDRGKVEALIRAKL